MNGHEGKMLINKGIENIKKNNILLKFLGFGLAIAPALLIAILIFKNSVNVPFWDDWEISFFFDKIIPQYRLTLQDCLAQANETRYLFPRFIFLGLTYLNNWNWDVRNQMWLSLALACLVSINVFRLIKWTIGENFFKVICSIILCNLLIFSPVQYENWLWGIQLIVFMPIVCITTCLVVIYSSIDRKIKLITYLILCTISTFSYANGMFSWIILFPILAISKSWNLQDIFKEKWLYIPCIATFTANMAVYFYNYQKPPYSPSFMYGILHPDQALQYFLSFLGSPLMRATIRYDWKILSLVNNNIWMGTVLIILFLGSLIYFVKQRKDSTVIYRMTGWFTIGFYSVISGLVTSFGRSGVGLESSVALRYTTFSIYLPLALINLMWIIYDDAKIKGYLLKNSQRMVQAVIMILLAGFLYFHIITVDFSIPQMYLMKLERLQAKACYIFLNVAPEENCIIEKVYPHFPGLKYRAYLVESQGIIDAKLLKSNSIQDIKGTNRANSKEFINGWFEQLNKIDETNYLAGGWAILPEKKEPADAVILTYEQNNGEDIIFAVFDTRVNRPDVVKALKRTTYSMSGLQKTFPASKLPKGLVKIKAWAFDTETTKAYQIAGTQVVKN